jgi:hypothetical protein
VLSNKVVTQAYQWCAVYTGKNRALTEDEQREYERDREIVIRYKQGESLQAIFERSIVHLAELDKQHPLMPLSKHMLEMYRIDLAESIAE